MLRHAVQAWAAKSFVLFSDGRVGIMSRVANNPVAIPKGVQIGVTDTEVSVKGPLGQLNLEVSPRVKVSEADGSLTFAAADREARALAGTTRAHVNNMVVGVTNGFEKKLQLIGVGYRAQVQGQKLNLTVGYSHPVEYPLPDGVKAETPSATEIVLKGMDRQLVGQVAAEVRAVRPPEPYKGKGIRVEGEYVRRKEAKKK